SLSHQVQPLNAAAPPALMTPLSKSRRVMPRSFSGELCLLIRPFFGLIIQMVNLVDCGSAALRAPVLFRGLLKFCVCGEAMPWCSAGFQTCCIADFQIGGACDRARLVGLETHDTADLEVCATSAAAVGRAKVGLRFIFLLAKSPD